MEIVINRCYGGFGLSYEAMMMWAKLKGMKLYSYASARDKGGHLDFDKYVPYHPGDKDVFCIHYSKNPLTKRGDVRKSGYVSEHDIKRDDPDLVKVVRTLKKKADGEHAELKIVNIPDGTEWELDEYDGIESIHEKHRSWG